MPSSDRENYCFPSIVKNTDKEDLKLSKVRREKWLAKNFRKDLTDRQLQKNKNKNQNNAFCLSFIGFFT